MMEMVERARYCFLMMMSSEKLYRTLSTINKTMLLHCLKCRINTESKNLNIVKTKIGKLMLLSKCEVCDSKKSKFINKQESSEIVSSFVIKTLLSKIPLVGLFLVLRVMKKSIKGIKSMK